MKSSGAWRQDDASWVQEFAPGAGELRALRNGAHIVLRSPGETMDLELEIGEPPESADLKAQYDHDVVMAAFSIFMRRLSAAIFATALIPSDPRVLQLWAEEALKEANLKTRS